MVVIISVVQIQNLPRNKTGSEVGNTNMAAIFSPCQEVHGSRGEGHVTDRTQLSVWFGRGKGRYEGIQCRDGEGCNIEDRNNSILSSDSEMTPCTRKACRKTSPSLVLRHGTNIA